jgi:preprotein translocase subunit SecG
VFCTIGAVAGNEHAAIPAAALAGTPIFVGTPSSNISGSTLSATFLAIIIAIVVIVLVVLGLIFVYMRKHKA